MMRAAGALLFALFLFSSVMLYRKEEGRRLAEYEGLFQLIRHIANALSNLPVPLAEIYARFENDALRRAGFLSVLQAEGLTAALKSGTLALEEEELAPFYSYAKELGQRLYAEEKRAADDLSREAEETLVRKRALLPQRQKLTTALSLSGGGLLLLLLL